jgi:hypothetical protein
MKKVMYHNASMGNVLIMTLGSTILVLLILVSFTGAGLFADISKSGSNNASNLNKFDKAMKSYNRAIEINPRDSDTWYNKGITLAKW